MISNFVINRIWAAFRSMLGARATGWIAAAILALAAILTRCYPGAEGVITEVRDAATNMVWEHEQEIQDAVDKLPDNIAK